MSWPEASPRDVVKVYVPVNDAGVPQNAARVKESEMRAALGVMPDQRSRQERTFPALHIGGEGLQHAGTERQAQPQEQPRGEGQDLEFFSTGWMEIMAMCSHKHDSKINAPLRMGLRLPESAEFVKSLMRHFG